VTATTISGTVIPQPGMLYGSVLAISTSDYQVTASGQIQTDNTYVIELPDAGSYYIIAMGYGFEDIQPAYSGAYPDYYNPTVVTVNADQQVENINFTMQPYPPYLTYQTGEPEQSGNHTLYPLRRFFMVIPQMWAIKLYEENNAVKIATFVDYTYETPLEIPLTTNNTLVMQSNLEIGDSWTSTVPQLNDGTGHYDAVIVTTIVQTTESVVVDGTPLMAWRLITATEDGHLYRRDWFVPGMGFVKQCEYDGTYLVFKQLPLHFELQPSTQLMPLAANNAWYYNYQIPEYPTDLNYQPGNASHFFTWERPVESAQHWTEYRFYEDGVMLAQLPIDQPYYTVLQDPGHTHNYYVSAWSNGTESQFSNVVVIEAQGNQPEPQISPVLNMSAYPNPWKPENGVLKMKLNLPQSASTTLSVYNIRGQKVRTIALPQAQKGALDLQWDGKNEQGEAVASGIYLMRLQNGKQHIEKRIGLLR
jgi:hypothetical protein